jgi:hypothetical protein
VSEHDEDEDLPEENEKDLEEEDLDPDEDEEVDPTEPRAERRRRRLERILPELLKRAIEKGLETGLGTLSNSRDALRGVVGENVKLPQEIVQYIFAQIDDTKSATTRVVAREVREFLAATDLSKELQKALTSLSFEIRTEIRFIPNEAGGITPEVKAEVDPKRTRSKKKKKEPVADEDE